MRLRPLPDGEKRASPRGRRLPRRQHHRSGAPREASRPGPLSPFGAAAVDRPPADGVYPYTRALPFTFTMDAVYGNVNGNVYEKKKGRPPIIE